MSDSRQAPKRWRAAAIGLMAAWLLGFGPPAQAEKASAELEKQRLAELRARIEKLQRDIAKSEESRSEATDALKASEKAISEVNRNLVVLSREEGKIGRAHV